MTMQTYDGTGGLMVYEEPSAVLARQAKMANELMKVIKEQGDDNPFSVKIKDHKTEFLRFEAWTLIARFNNAHVELEGDVVPVYEDDHLVAWSATAIVVDNASGMRLSRAQMECGVNAFPTQAKLGREKVKAAQSSAQTWAGAKACRMVFSFIAVLAGYAATTAEEMMGEGVATVTAVEGEAVSCPEHPGEMFFKKGGMKGYAHKTGDKTWHNWTPNIFRNQVDTLREALGWEAEAITALCNEKFDRNWSGLNPDQLMQLLDMLAELAEDVATTQEDTPVEALPAPEDSDAAPQADPGTKED